jgi:hypothetical protein
MDRVWTFPYLDVPNMRRIHASYLSPCTDPYCKNNFTAKQENVWSYVMPFGGRLEINQNYGTYGISYHLPGEDGPLVHHTKVYPIPRSSRNRSHLVSVSLCEMLETFDQNVTLINGKWYWGHIEMAIHNFVCSLIDVPSDINKRHGYTPTHCGLGGSLSQTKTNKKLSASFICFTLQILIIV